MGKLSKAELLKKINEKVTDVDLATEIMEDIEDSFEGSDTSELEQQIEDLQTQKAELKQKYKDRFLKGTEIDTGSNKKEPEIDNDVPEEPKKFEDLFNEKGELK